MFSSLLPLQLLRHTPLEPTVSGTAMYRVLQPPVVASTKAETGHGRAGKGASEIGHRECGLNDNFEHSAVGEGHTIVEER